MRIASETLIACTAIACTAMFAQQAQSPQVPQKPGIKGVQHHMSKIVPDAEYPIEGSPDWLAIGEDMVWVNSKPKDFVSRMDPRTNQVVATVPVTKPCSGLIIGAGSLWSPSCEENVLYRIDLQTNKTVAKLPVGPANTEGGIAFGAGSIWMPSDPKGVVSRIDPAGNKVIATIEVPSGSFTAIFGYGLVWVSSTENHLVSVIHPASNKVIAKIPVDSAPRFMAVGEGHVWTLNQTNGTVSKIDPVEMKAVATIDAGLPGTGGEIAAGEGAVWVTARTIPVTRIDPVKNKVTAQFYGPGGDAIEVGHGSVWLSNGRWSNVWRFLPGKLETAAPANWMSRAQPFDLDGDRKPDLLLEDLATWIPGEPTQFRMRVLNPEIGTKFTLKTKLNKQESQAQFTKSGEDWVATFTGSEPRWIHYSVCSAKSQCSPALVVASPTTQTVYAKKRLEFVPPTFLAPRPPTIGDYVWNILEPAILDPDYQALLDRAGSAGPIGITKAEDYGELKRHQWEFQNTSAFSWGILTPDKTSELACVYIYPSPKQGYDAMIRFWVTKQGAEAGLEPILDKQVREWIAARWPFKKVAYPGRDIEMKDWNALPDASF